MRQVVRIDANGFFVEDVILVDGEAIPEDCVEVRVPTETQGFYKAKWNDGEWIEGGRAPEPQPITATTEEEMKMLKKRQDESENAIMTLMEIALMGGM